MPGEITVEFCLVRFNSLQKKLHCIKFKVTISYPFINFLKHFFYTSVVTGFIEKALGVPAGNH